MDIRSRVKPLVRKLPLKNGTELKAVEAETVVFLCQQLCKEVIKTIENGTVGQIAELKSQINNIEEK